MTLDLSRRRMMQAAGTRALAPAMVSAAPAVSAAKSWPIVEGPETPKLCLGTSDGLAPEGQEEAGPKRIKQLAVDYCLGGGPRIPWQEADLRALDYDRQQPGFRGGYAGIAYNVAYARAMLQAALVSS